jgi:chromosome segregation ATPase
MAVQKISRGLIDRIVRVVDFRIDERMRALVDRVNNLEHATADHRRRLDSAEHGLEQARGDLRWTRAELDRLIPHVAAQEGRLETLRESISLVPSGDSHQIAEARTLIEEIQRQHAQIRVRLAGISRYEDRLRRIEDQISVSAGE